MAKKGKMPRPPKPPGATGSPRTGKRPRVASQLAHPTTKEVHFVIQPYRLWTFQTETEKTIFEGLANDSDRAAGIIAGSIIDVRLTAAIQSRSQRDPKIEARMFLSSGPLGSFSAKIDLAYMMGILSAQAHADITTIKEIRNKFAHDLSIKDFQSTGIAARTMNLTLIDSHVRDMPANGDEISWVDMTHGAVPKTGFPNLASQKNKPRERYLIVCSVVAVALGAAEMKTTGPYI